jgi:hypothetical protein
MRNSILIGLTAAGLYILLAVQCALAPSALMYDEVSGRIERVYNPDSRPVLIVVADWFACR